MMKRITKTDKGITGGPAQSLPAWTWGLAAGLSLLGLAAATRSESRAARQIQPAPTPTVASHRAWWIILGTLTSVLICGSAAVVANTPRTPATRSRRRISPCPSSWALRVLNEVEMPIVSFTPDGVIRTFNRAAERLFGFQAGMMPGQSGFADLVEPGELGLRALELGAELGRPIAPGFEVLTARAPLDVPQEREWTCVRADGQRFPARVTVSPLPDTAGAPQGFVAVVRDLTEERRAAAEWLQFKEDATRRITALAEQKAALDQHSIVAVTDTTGRILYANDKFCEISKYAREELLGQDHRIIKSGHHPTAFWQEMYRTIARGEVWRGEIKNRAKDGSFYWVHSVIVPLKDEHGRPHRYVAVRTDITARKQAEEDIRAMHDTLRKAHREVLRRHEENQDFYHTLSHELKTPLTSAREFVAIVRDGLAGPVTDSQKEYLGIALDSCQQLGVCINDLLDATRVETGKLNIALRPATLSTLAPRLMTAFSPTAQPKRIALRCEVQPDLPEIPCDEVRIAQVINNLLANALKFTPDGGSVTLRVGEATRHHDFVQVSVSDTGPGIDADKRGRVFDRLYQIQHGDAAGGQGLGLGLYICRELVQIHGGKIWVESEPGQGSTFAFVLPKHPAVRRWSLLVVDDDPQMRQVVCDILEQAEFNVTTAASGGEALRVIARQSPDLVLLDVMMPDLDGATTMQEIRQRWADLPVILHTGFPHSDVVTRARQWSPLAVLAKPWLPRQLLETLRAARLRRETEFWTRRETISLASKPPCAAPDESHPDNLA